MRRLVVIPAAIAAATLGLAGTASANAYTADATCSGFTLDLPRAEDGTIVTLTRNGTTVRTDTVTTFGAPVRYTVASPDQTVAQSWRVTIDSRWNEDYTYAETVPACTSSTTITAPPTTVPTTAPTTVPPSSTSTPPSAPVSSDVPTTTVVAVTTPPLVPSTTVVTPPGRPTSTTTTTPPTFTLPETGWEWTERVGFVAGAMLAIGLFLVLVRRRGGVA